MKELMKEIKIGERVTITLEAVEQKGCDGCFFEDRNPCYYNPTINESMEILQCCAKYRSDGKDVIFKLVNNLVNV